MICSFKLLVFLSLPASSDRLVQLHDLFPRLQQLQVEVVLAPLRPNSLDTPLEPALTRRMALVHDGSSETTTIYAMFRKSTSPTGRLPIPPLPSHLEFLIDRQGYIRARWLAGDGPGWAETTELLSTMDGLNREKSRRPFPDASID